MGSFYPRSPCGERPPRGGFCYLDNIVSIHALLAESDDARRFQSFCQSGFLSTLSLRRATSMAFTPDEAHSLFLSTLSLRRATKIMRSARLRRCVSIHALLAESDAPLADRAQADAAVSIHALLAESDYTMTTTICIVLRFLSTLSLRRATRQRG